MSSIEELEKQINSLLYIVSHDLKAPMRGTRSYMTLFEEETCEKLSEEEMTFFKKAQEEFDCLESRLEQILKLSRIRPDTIELKTIDVSTTLEEALPLVKEAFPDKKIHLNIGDLPRNILFDPRLFKDLCIEILSNSVKFNDHPDVAIEVFIKNNQWLTFSDNGIGISSDLQEDCLKLFRRLHPKGVYGPGDGFGLAFIERILNAHGKSLKIDSPNDQGIQVLISL